MSVVKEQRITYGLTKKRFFDITNINHQIEKQQLTFIGKVVHNYDEQLPTNILNACYKHRQRPGGIIHADKNSIS